MKKIIYSVLGLVFLFALTGCGSSSDISSRLNEVVKDDVDTWVDKGYAHTFTLSDIQNSLNSKGYNLTIIASGDSEFKSSISNTKYTESVDNYKGSLYSNMRMLEKDMNVNYCLVLNKDNNKYYSIKITYKTTMLNGTEKEYPYFDNDKEL